MRRVLLGVLAVVVLAWAGFGAVLFLMQERMVFLPDFAGRELRASPADLGLAYEDLQLVAADGTRLHGWFVPAPGARRTLLHLHGNAGTIADRLELLAIFHDLGLDVMMLEYRGYGRSGGRPSEQGTYQDAQAAWDHLVGVRGRAPASILVHGQSMGGGVASWLASRERPGALILESTFTSVPDVAAGLYPWLPVRWLARVRYDTASRLPQVRCPVLIVHSREDEIIPYAHGERLHALARPPKQLLTLQGDHNTGVLRSARDYADGLRAFIDALPPPP